MDARNNSAHDACGARGGSLQVAEDLNRAAAVKSAGDDDYWPVGVGWRT